MHKNSTSRIAASIIAALTVLVACRTPVRTAAAQVDPGLDPKVDKILTRLENRKVHDLSADLTWQRAYQIDEEEDPADIKKGKIWFKDAQPTPKFKVEFKVKIAAGRKHKLDEQHLFDGFWYHELQSKTKTVTRRQLRRKSDPANPYKIGEGPFPLPFGQKKADILSEFEVSRVPPAADDPPHTDHLKLSPRPGTRTAERYDRVDFWVVGEGDKLNGLPIKVVAHKKGRTKQSGSTVTISFSKVKLNPGFSQSVFKIETPRGYEEITESLDAPTLAQPQKPNP